MDNPAALTTPTPEMLAALTAAREARGEVIGQLQTELHDQIEPVVQNRRDVQAAALKDLRKQVRTIAKNRRKAIDLVLSDIGEVGATIKGPRALQVAAAANAAGRGQLALPPDLIDLIPPDPPPVTPAGFSPMHPASAGGAAASVPQSTTPTIGGQQCQPGQVLDPVHGCVAKTGALGPSAPPPAFPGAPKGVAPALLPATQPAPTVPTATPVQPIALPIPPGTGPVAAAVAAAVQGGYNVAAAQGIQLIAVQPCPGFVGAGLPDVGTPEWCACVEQLVAWLTDIGNQFQAMLSQILSPDTLGFIGRVAASLVGGLKLAPTVVGGALTAGGQLVQGEVEQAAQTVAATAQQGAAEAAAFATTLEQIANMVQSGLAVAANWAGANSAALVGLSLARSILRALRRVRLGTDALLWLTVDIDVELRPLETVLDYLENYLFPYQIPDVGTAMECWYNYTASWEQVNCWFLTHGVKRSQNSPVILAGRTKISDSERIEYGYRHGETFADIYQGLREYGFILDIDTVRRLDLHFATPSESELWDWHNRNLGNAAIVSRYGLDAEFSDLFWPQYGGLAQAGGSRPDWALLRWEAHWTPLGIGELQELLHRLGTQGDANGLTFSDVDYQNHLEFAGYSPWTVQRLMAVRYRPVSIRHVNIGLDTGQLTQEDALATLRATGMSPDNADKLSRSLAIMSARRVAKAADGWTIQKVVATIHAGLFTFDQGMTALTGQGYTERLLNEAIATYNDTYIAGLEQASRREALKKYTAQTLDAYKDGATDAPTAIAALVSAGYLSGAAQLEIQAIDIGVKRDTLKEGMAAVRRYYLTGAVNLAGAMAALVQVGMEPNRAQLVANRWSLLLLPGRIAATAGKLVGYARQGIISIPNLVARLTNLGWSTDAISLQVLELEAALQSAAAKAANAKAKNLAAAQKAAKALLSKTEQQFCRMYTPGRLIKWFAMGRMDEASMRDKLHKCGTPNDVIDNLIAEAQGAKAKYQASGGKPTRAAKATGKVVKKLLSAGKLKTLYKEEVIDGQQLREGLSALGYTGAELAQLVAEAELDRGGFKKSGPPSPIPAAGP